MLEKSMLNGSIEFTDVFIFLVVTLAVMAWSYHTLDRDKKNVDNLKARNQRIPWRFRHFVGKSMQDLKADLLGRGMAFFLMLTGFSWLKTLGLPLAYRLAASALVCVILFATLPRLGIFITRCLKKSPESSNQQ